ncbi:MAG: thiamine pyrophosphate-dependent dehydrogenase E1 component subunit alpha [Verrucomicrobiia bacterium]
MTAVNPIPTETMRWMYRQMVLIRETEEAIARLYHEQQMRCPTHLCGGQEAVAVGLCAGLRADDYVFGTYRSHGIYLAKGGDLKQMMAELYGKVTGCARGKGGSMQLVSPEAGLLCASALVGGTIPEAVGAALAIKLRREERVSAAFFGDAATEEGVWHEAMNFASLRKLPVIFMCENNFFAVYTHISHRQAEDNIYKRAASYGMPGVRVDGNKALEVYEAVREAVERARSGGGPSLIEARTYRWREHCGPNCDEELSYRNPDEAKAWMTRCPIQQLDQFLTQQQLMGDSQRAAVRREVLSEIEAAVTFAKSSPFPDASELMQGVYAP